MKVDLGKLRLGLTALGERICIGTPNKDNISFKESHDVTNDFIKAVIDWGAGYSRKISCTDGTQYKITVEKIKP